MKIKLLAVFACLWIAAACGGSALGEPMNADADPLRVASAMLSGAEGIAQLDAAAVAQSAAGPGLTITLDGAAAVITAVEEEAWACVGGSLRDYDNGMELFNRAALIRFLFPEFWNVQIAVGEYWLQFYETGYPMFGGSAYPYPNYCFGEFPQSFRLEANVWTYCLVAFDGDGNCRFVLWQEGRADVQGYYARKLMGDGDMARMAAAGELPDWRLSVKLYAGETVQISDCTVLRFEELIQ